MVLMAIVTDALSMSWCGTNGYFFLPFSCLSCLLQKVTGGTERDPDSTKLTDTAVVTYAEGTTGLPTSQDDTNQGEHASTEGKDQETLPTDRHDVITGGGTLKGMFEAMGGEW